MVFDLQPHAHGVVKIRRVPLPFTVEQISEIFKSHDRNKDGQLSKDELRAAFNQLGSLFPQFRVYRACKYADNDRDGRINLSNEEFSALIDYAHSCGYKVY